MGKLDEHNDRIEDVVVSPEAVETTVEDPSAAETIVEERAETGEQVRGALLQVDAVSYDDFANDPDKLRVAFNQIDFSKSNQVDAMLSTLKDLNKAVKEQKPENSEVLKVELTKGLDLLARKHFTKLFRESGILGLEAKMSFDEAGEVKFEFEGRRLISWDPEDKNYEDELSEAHGVDKNADELRYLAQDRNEVESRLMKWFLRKDLKVESYDSRIEPFKADTESLKKLRKFLEEEVKTRDIRNLTEESRKK